MGLKLGLANQEQLYKWYRKGLVCYRCATKMHYLCTGYRSDMSKFGGKVPCECPH